MGKNQGFRDLEIYNLSVALALDVYRIIDRLPEKEKYCIKGQLGQYSKLDRGEHCRGIRKIFRQGFCKVFIHSTWFPDGSAALSDNFQGARLYDEKILIEQDQKIRNLGIKLNNLIKTIYNTTEKRAAKSN